MSICNRMPIPRVDAQNNIPVTTGTLYYLQRVFTPSLTILPPLARFFSSVRFSSCGYCNY